jgi:hypothetical protein
MSKMFQDLEQFSAGDVAAAVERNDPEELQLVSITIALSGPDQRLAEETCLTLSASAHRKVRAHAVMSLGYIARRFRRLDEQRVKPVIEAALVEPDEYVRTHAKAAADEICQFLHWDIRGHVYGSGPDPAALPESRRSRSEP